MLGSAEISRNYIFLTIMMDCGYLLQYADARHKVLGDAKQARVRGAT